MEGNFKISAKVDNKWRTFGNLKKNQYGNYQLSFKSTDEFKQFISGKDWINFSLFPAEDKPVDVAADTRATIDKMTEAVKPKPYVHDDQEIPF